MGTSTAKSAPVLHADGVDPIVDVVARADHAAFAERFADDVVFHSPAARFTLRGREVTSALCEALMRESDPDRWRVQEFWDLGDTHIMGLTTTVGGHQLDLLTLARLDERGQIRELTGYARPMASIAVLPAFVYPHLVTRFRGRARAAVIRVLCRPLPRILEVGVAAGFRFGQPPDTEFDVPA